MSAELAADAIEHAADVVITVGPDGIITSWNAAAERVLGHPAAAAIGQSLALIVPEEHRPRHIAGFRAAMASGELAHHGHPALVEGTGADGTRVPLEMTLAVLPAQDGKGPAGVVAVLRRDATTPISFIRP